MKNSDINILIPIDGALDKSVAFEKDEASLEFVKNLNEQMNYACDVSIASMLDRGSFGRVKISTYTGDLFNRETMGWRDASVSYTYQEETNLGIINLHIHGYDGEDSVVGDSVFSDQLKIKIDKEYSVEDFLEKLGVKQCGQPRMVYRNDLDSKSDDNLNYLLLGESAIRENESFGLREDAYIKDIIEKENKCIYETIEFYASEKAAVIFVRNYKRGQTKGNFNEKLFFMMLEIAVLQSAAIFRTSSYIKNKLVNKEKGHISSSKALRLIEQYGKTIKLWDSAIYNYSFDQIIADYLIRKFRIAESKAQLDNLKDHIQQVSDLKRNINSSMESAVLNIIAFILGITQLIQIIPNIKPFLEGKVELNVLLGVIVLFFIILVIKHNKENEL